MIKKIIFNAVIVIVLLMIGVAIIKANKPKSGPSETVLSNPGKSVSNLSPREAKYYKVIEE